MAFKWGKKSQLQRATLHPDLQRVLDRALAFGVIDFGINEGHRGQEAQERAFTEGRSQKHWPKGNHNAYPSNAADLMPAMPKAVDPWSAAALPYWHVLAGVVLAAAAAEGVAIRWGGDFNMNRDLTEKEFKDLPHFERRP